MLDPPNVKPDRNYDRNYDRNSDRNSTPGIAKRLALPVGFAQKDKEISVWLGE